MTERNLPTPTPVPREVIAVWELTAGSRVSPPDPQVRSGVSRDREDGQSVGEQEAGYLHISMWRGGVAIHVAQLGCPLPR
jgi:hypothetical protein